MREHGIGQVDDLQHNTDIIVPALQRTFGVMKAILYLLVMGWLSNRLEAQINVSEHLLRSLGWLLHRQFWKKVCQ